MLFRLNWPQVWSLKCCLLATIFLKTLASSRLSSSFFGSTRSWRQAEFMKPRGVGLIPPRVSFSSVMTKARAQKSRMCSAVANFSIDDSCSLLDSLEISLYTLSIWGWVIGSHKFRSAISLASSDRKWLIVWKIWPIDVTISIFELRFRSLYLLYFSFMYPIIEVPRMYVGGGLVFVTRVRILSRFCAFCMGFFLFPESCKFWRARYWSVSLTERFILFSFMCWMSRDMFLFCSDIWFPNWEANC